MKLRASRLAVRLLAFNVVLVFLPIAGVLFLGEYEERLETAEIRDVTHRARLIAAAIAREGTLDEDAFEDVIHRAKIDDLRVRLIDSLGRVVADSREIVAPAPQMPRTDRRNFLYRIGAFLVRPILRLVRPPEQPLEVDYYANASRLEGPEIASVLRGREHFEKKISAQQQRSVTLYRMVPVVVGGWTVGAVVASKSTFAILQELYVVRLRVMRIFIASLVVAILISVFFSMSIVRPLRQLRIDARAVLDRRGRLLRGAHFKGSRRLDEIGELSRGLERIMRRLDAHVGYIETFTGDVVHELKNPLASIRNANEMIADVGDPADRRRFVRVIEQEVARMERLLSGVREITAIDARLATEQPVEVDLGALLAKIVDGFRLREGERVRFQLGFQLDMGPGPLLVDATEDRLTQVFENLLDNALSFSPPGSTVIISAGVEDGEVVTRIADMGPGIPEANMTRIFDRFFTHRPDASRRHEGGHTGLGLAIVRTIVEGYGGAIGAANAERGAVFTVRLPRRGPRP
jgi:two-component system sensor histidine kinase ChvG